MRVIARGAAAAPAVSGVGRSPLATPVGHAVERVHVRLGGGDDDVGVGAVPGGAGAVVAEAHAHLADGVDAGGHRLHRELLELALHLAELVDGAVGGVDRAVADRRRLVRQAVGEQHAHRRGGPQLGAAADLQVLEVVLLVAGAALVGDDRLEVAVGDVALAVGELLEAHEGALQLLLVERVAELLEAVAQRVAAGELAEHQRAAGAHLGGLHDLEGAAVLEHAVLVDAGVVREGVGADHRLVGLHHHAGELGDQPRGAVQLGVVELRGHAEHLGVQPRRHGHLLERGVAGALADAVDARLDLARAGADRRQRVGDGQPEVVVAVHGEGDAGERRARASYSQSMRPRHSSGVA